METKKKILIVEDEPFLLKTVANRLIEDGFIIDSATDGNEALERIKAGDYSLMLLDILMPGKDGISVLKYIKENNLSVPTIVFTNLSKGDIEKDLREFNIKGYFLKASHSIDEVAKMVSVFA